MSSGRGLRCRLHDTWASPTCPHETTGRYGGSEVVAARTEPVVQRVQVRAVARCRLPLACVLDRRSLRPFVEADHELPRRIRRNHVRDVVPPAVEVARETRRRFTRL